MSVIYGIHAVTEALKARRVSRLMHERGAGPRVDALVARAHELRIPIETLDRRALDKLTRGGVHQGVAAELQPLAAYTVEELVARPTGAGRCSSCSTASRIRRTSARFCDRPMRPARTASSGRRGTRRRSTARRPRRRPARSTHVRIATVVNIARALEELKELDVWTIGFDAERVRRATTRWTTRCRRRSCLGAEGTGLRRLVRETCDRLVAIPMAGAVSSLNVSVSAGVALFEAARQRRRQVGQRLD